MSKDKNIFYKEKRYTNLFAVGVHIVAYHDTTMKKRRQIFQTGLGKSTCYSICSVACRYGRLSKKNEVYIQKKLEEARILADEWNSPFLTKIKEILNEEN